MTEVIQSEHAEVGSKFVLLFLQLLDLCHAEHKHRQDLLVAVLGECGAAVRAERIKNAWRRAP